MSNVSKKHLEETEKARKEISAAQEIMNKGTTGWNSSGGWGAPPPKTK